MAARVSAWRSLAGDHAPATDEGTDEMKTLLLAAVAALGASARPAPTKL
jgi:hypothetical protein